MHHLAGSPSQCSTMDPIPCSREQKAEVHPEKILGTQKNSMGPANAPHATWYNLLPLF